MTILKENMKVDVHCGIHGRVAVDLAKIAENWNVELQISCGDQQVNCGSILELLSLALVEGSQIIVHADGDNAENALAEVRCLLSGEKTG